MSCIVTHFSGIDHTMSDLEKKYPEFTFLDIKQVHGDKLVYASNHKEEADAHWTDKTDLALIIKTADCIPVLISHPDYICAIHAGWRGVLNEIVFKSLKYLVSKYSNKDKIKIEMGPHIQIQSFEISKDLFPDFHACAQKYAVKDFFRQKPNNIEKYYIDLSTLVLGQLNSLGIGISQINVSSIDTMTHSGFNSYRRTSKEKTISPTASESTQWAGRNYSFVARRLKS